MVQCLHQLWVPFSFNKKQPKDSQASWYLKISITDMRLDSHLDFFDSLRIGGLVNCRSRILTWIETTRWMDKMITVVTYASTMRPTGDKVGGTCRVPALVLSSVGFTHWFICFISSIVLGAKQSNVLPANRVAVCLRQIPCPL